MNTQAFLWLCIGAMTGVAASLLIARLWRDAASRRRWLIAVVAVPILAVLVYLQMGRPEMAGRGSTSGSLTTEAMRNTAALLEGHTNTSASTTSGAGSMTEVTARLVSKLSAGEGTDADWQLLQQAYAFMGDDASAALAAQHQLPSATGTTAAAATDATAQAVPVRTLQDLSVYEQAVQQRPTDAKAWLSLAQAQRSARNFTASVQAFDKVLALKGQQSMDASAWADYADAAASVSGSLDNSKTRAALDAALKLQPTHNKALWLKASMLLEDKQYVQSLTVWQQLRAALPAGSPDLSIIDANIAEAQSLSGNAAQWSRAVPVTATTKTAQTKNSSPAPASAQITGTVQVADALKAKATNGMTLFVYAKAVGSPMPVAVYRVAVTTWPVKFVLDDSSAMIAGRALSQFDSVTVEARLSRSGQAAAQAGDLQSELVTVKPHARQRITLSLSKQVS